MIRGVIFDADGTLLDSMRIWNELGPRYITSRGKEPEADISLQLSKLSVDEGCAYLKEHYCLPESTEEVKAAVIGIISDFYKNEVSLKNGAYEAIKLFAKLDIPMAVATSGDKALMTAAFDRLGVLHHFKSILTCSELGTNKREPLIYDKAAEVLGTDPSKTLVVEDVLYTVETAKSAGFITLAVDDDSSAYERDKIKKAAYFYMPDLSDIEKLNTIITGI